MCEIRKIDSSDAAVNRIARSWLCLLSRRNCQSQGKFGVEEMLDRGSEEEVAERRSTRLGR